MRTGKSVIIIRTAVIAAILLLVPMFASAMGNGETNTYGQALEDRVMEIAEALQNSEINQGEAVQLLNQFRISHGREDNAEYQAMAGLLEKVQAGDLSREQLRDQLRDFEECRDQTRLRTRDGEEPEQTRDRIKDGTGDHEPDQTRDQIKDGAGAASQAGGGSVNSGNPSPKK